ncbi:glycoside hydrolase, partial [Streptomyces sp. SID10244]|nr:glycoside hydrolase [Streptomyces sp. SID10244]
MYGRWEICARSTIGSAAWTPMALLWPDAEDWPDGGEVDFMEISYPLRDRVDYNLHWGNATNLERHTIAVN